MNNLYLIITTDKITLNKHQIKLLKQTRDTLLPKLMSGKLRVEEFKIDIE